jgi:Xaa-Pro aminopeptidase
MSEAELKRLILHFALSNRLAANQAVELAKAFIELRLNKTKIDIDSYRWWPVFCQQTFLELCPGVQLVECHRLFGEICRPKGTEEPALIHKAIQISDMAHYTFLAYPNIFPGKNNDNIKTNQYLILLK